MKKRIVTIGAWHERTVRDAIDNFQKSSFEVQEVRRISKMFLGIFGEDVTEITYTKIK